MKKIKMCKMCLEKPAMKNSDYCKECEEITKENIHKELKS